MKIVYVGNHRQVNSNDDEGSIAWSLRQLGHEVLELDEKQNTSVIQARGDLVLFHKWEEARAVPVLRRLRMEGIPTVFWYFDLVDSLNGLGKHEHNEALRWRTNTRKKWMEQIIPHVTMGFCTDGDWVIGCPYDTKGKLRWLPQGMDPRLVSTEKPNVQTLSGVGLYKELDILCVGGINGYPRRLELFNELKARYGERFVLLGNGGPSARKHGKELASVIASSKIVICPDSPVTDNYWSNRVYNMLGFGAFVLHPYCTQLTKQYMDGVDLVMYISRESLYEKIDHYLESPDERDLIAASGHLTTQMEHTYLHRCEHMMELVKERIGK